MIYVKAMKPLSLNSGTNALKPEFPLEQINCITKQNEILPTV